ncbi:MAG: BrnT family toxin [Phycisphaerales bacterium]
MMKLRGIIWLDSVVEKTDRKHGVSQEEAHQVLQGPAMFRYVEKGHRSREDVYAALGRTVAGRHMIVFFVHKLDHCALILPARNMTDAERRRYEKK